MAGDLARGVARRCGGGRGGWRERRASTIRMAEGGEGALAHEGPLLPWRDAYLRSLVGWQQIGGMALVGWHQIGGMPLVGCPLIRREESGRW